jgi:hypothetical protein
MLASTRYRDPADVVAADPGLLEVEVWRLFEVEGGGEDSLTAHEKYTGDRWGDFFRGQAARDPAMRSRLLDASLAALGRDFATFRAGWFSRFHESLAPTDDERAARAHSYLGLLRSRSAPTVSFAVAALTRISRAGRLSAESVLGRIGPVLHDSPAGTAKAALALVERAGGDPALARDAAIVATGALANPAPDVQRAAIALVGRLIREPDAAVAVGLAERAGDVAATQRVALMTLLAHLGGSVEQRQDPPVSGPSGARAGTDSAASSPPSVRPSPLDPDRALPALDPLDELVDVAVSLIETGEPADDVERVLEAVGRLGADRPEGFTRLTTALARRAGTILARRENVPFNGSDARADIAAVLLAWTIGEVVPAGPKLSGVDPGAGAFLSARAREVATAVAAGSPFRSVAAPTHRGGWIDPLVLVERLTVRPPASRLDLVAALLRLAPEGRDQALAAAGRLSDEAGAATRYALGGVETIGPTAAWWIAAARTRAPGQDDERVERRHPRLGPDAGLAARVTFVTREPKTMPEGSVSYGEVGLDAEPRPARGVSVELPTVLMFHDPSVRSWAGRVEPAMLRWIATVQPGYREAWAAAGSVVLGRNLDWWSAEWANRAFLEPFIDPVTEIGPMARRLLGIAIGAKEAGERGLATDIVRLALADGRMVDEQLAEGLVSAAVIGHDRPSRWALSLAEISAASDAQARAVIRATGGAMPALVHRPAAKLVPMLRLLDELLTETSESLPTAAKPPLHALAEREGQAGRLARSILARG